MKIFNFINMVSLDDCFRGRFPKFSENLISYLWTVASVIGLYLRRGFHILPIHFYLNLSKSQGCTRVYVIRLARSCY